MGALKKKATTKSGGGALKSKASAKKEPPVEELAASEPKEDTPNISSGLSFNAPPPLPPAFAYLRMLAQVPGLRKRDAGGI